MKKMHGQAYLLNRDGRYYFRRPIPPDLRGAFDGKTEFKVSLRTADKREAQRKVEHHTLETSKQIEAARARLQPHRRDHFTVPELQAFADEVKAKWLRDDEDFRLGGSAETLEMLEHGNSMLIDVVEQRSPVHPAIRAEVDDLLQHKALRVPHDSRAYLQLTEVVRAACEDALRSI